MQVKFLLALSMCIAPIAKASPVQETETGVTRNDPVDTARVRLTAYFKSEIDPESVFSPSFLAAVPISQVRQLIDAQKAEYGPFKGISIVSREPSGVTKLTASYERADVHMNMSVEAKSGLIDGLLITKVKAHDTSFATITKEIQGLHGVTAFTVTRLDEGGPTILASYNADKQMAIGSAFKLYILLALADEVSAGRMKWDQVVAVGTPSLASGVTQSWPKGSKTTIETLAILMISISDNTATDTLIQLVGRERIERKMVELGHKGLDRALPFLTTYEAFALKMPDNAELLKRWEATDAKGRAEILKNDAALIAGTTLDANQFTNVPRAIDSVEWFASPNDIVTLLVALDGHKDARVRDIMAVNPGISPTRKASVAYIGYKGGSEPGVLSMNFLVHAKDGKKYAIATSWSDPASTVETATLLRLAERLIDNVAAGGN